MLSYCLECRKNAESKNPKVKKEEYGFHLNVQSGIVKTQNLIKNKKQRSC